ncbi:hypothetical protein FLONG3_9396 [Fusarium longipes]|uniref:Uncharacterized protein n=1 Tax=Fusarium longipes TaxID=694270 RepID=A0A395RXP5_9HYPO|nr:hypothetical protein FLONG3_9396 [Fusarium longipes]
MTHGYHAANVGGQYPSDEPIQSVLTRNEHPVIDRLVKEAAVIILQHTPNDRKEVSQKPAVWLAKSMDLVCLEQSLTFNPGCLTKLVQEF